MTQTQPNHRDWALRLHGATRMVMSELFESRRRWRAREIWRLINRRNSRLHGSMGESGDRVDGIGEREPRSRLNRAASHERTYSNYRCSPNKGVGSGLIGYKDLSLKSRAFAHYKLCGFNTMGSN